MPKRSSKKNIRDVNVLAAHIIEQATGEPSPKLEDSTKNPAAVALGRLGGKKGGKARAEKLTSEERKEIAQKAARARWKPKEQILYGTDTIVFAVGSTPNTAIVKALEGKFPRIHVVGDAKGTRTALEAIHAGSRIGRLI